ncbi:hypothetical protein AAFF_G00262340 [Aldrovandia affinis]|uniref:Uncharacterized protein n=1 Tax=Aldrovandia affinis TaxID=143900 RepID=A0AAD7SUE1_9TELE|nr:hypothetical protein AAFF_G00262340 [Aldrovandia affinis]
MACSSGFGKRDWRGVKAEPLFFPSRDLPSTLRHGPQHRALLQCTAREVSSAAERTPDVTVNPSLISEGGG